MNNYLDVSNETNSDLTFDKRDVLSVSGDFGVVNQIEFQGRSFAGESVSNYGVLRTHQVVYTKSPLKANPYGIIKTNKGKNGIVSVLYGVYQPKENVCSELIQTYFEQDARLNNYLKPLVNKGAKNTLLISDKSAINGEITFPKQYEEQTKIYRLFEKLDSLITLHQRKFIYLNYFKSKFHSTNLEFKNTFSWEQRKLGDIGKTFTGLSGKTANDFGHGEAKFLPYLNIFNNPIADTSFLELIEIDPTQNKIQHGDVFFTTSSETPEEVGMSSIWLGNSDNIYLNSFCFGFRPNITIDSYYLGYYLRSNTFRKKIIVLAQGISRFNISKNKVLELSINLPSLEEQKLIGRYFKYLDESITLHQRKCDTLINIKKSLLQKMFPSNNNKVPDIRFKGFTDPWEQRKLDNILLNQSINICSTPSDIGRYEVIQQGDVPVIGYTNENPFEGYSDIVLFGDHTLSLYKPNSPFLAATDGIKAFCSKGISGMFLYYLLMKNLPKNEGYKRYSTILKDKEVWLTYNQDEQKRISEILLSLDSLITLHQRKCEKLKEMKKSLLQKMFI